MESEGLLGKLILALDEEVVADGTGGPGLQRRHVAWVLHESQGGFPGGPLDDAQRGLKAFVAGGPRDVLSPRLGLKDVCRANVIGDPLFHGWGDC
ncbi:MAG: hypothetical protein ACI9DF_005247 [Verrucomicrobiales bacterium]|jgi:hypothetical protein